MSRIGKTPVVLPNGVSAEVRPHLMVIKGPRGELNVPLPSGVKVVSTDTKLVIEKTGTDQILPALHGTLRAILNNAVVGVSQGWKKELELVGVGFRATVSGADLVLTVGFSHPVTISPPEGITLAVKEGKIVVSGIDKHLVGQVAANIRRIKPPEPYKGKGIKYVGEYIRKKAGKSAKGLGAAGLTGK